MAKCVDPDETARHEPSHQDLHCLHGYLFWSARLKGISVGVPLYLLVLFFFCSVFDSVVLCCHFMYLSDASGRLCFVVFQGYSISR